MEFTANSASAYRECPIKNTIALSSLFTFSKRRFAQNYSFKGESHDFTEVVCVTDGKVGITADKNVYVLNAGQMIIHPPSEFHAIWSDCGTEPETVIFSFRAELFPAMGQRVFTLSPERTAELKRIFSLAESAFSFSNENVESIRSGMENRACAVLKRLEAFLLAVFDDGKSGETAAKYTGRSAENYMRIVSVMEAGLSDSALTVGKIAALCNMSVPAVEKTVFRYLGCGAMAYLNEQRMKRAAELLQQGAPVKEAALSCGFSNQNYFSARFKKWSGASPSVWRASAKGEPQ